MNSETKKQYSFKINGQQAFTSDRTPTGSQLLSDAGFEPSDDFLLIERTRHGSRVISSDDNVDVGSEQAEFFAFSGGRAFELTVNEHSIFWGEPCIAVSMIRHLGNVPADEALVWQREDGTSEVLPDDGKFDIGRDGVEHLRTHKRKEPPPVYIYFVDNVEYKTEHESLTGAQIIAKLPQWNPAYSLVLEGEGAEKDEVIRDTTVVVFKGRECPAHFITVPPATFGRQ